MGFLSQRRCRGEAQTRHEIRCRGALPRLSQKSIFLAFRLPVYYKGLTGFKRGLG
jgi:hypothetical protein